jgi:predicted DNA-binding protein (MmcQ/YjbR family)
MPNLSGSEHEIMLNLESIRKICLSFPKVTEQLQWGDHLLFKIAGKMFAVASLEPSKAVLSFKVTPETFAELTERPSIIPAPYLARASWVALESFDALELAEAKALLRNSYDLVLARQPRRIRQSIAGHFKRSEPTSKSARNKVSRKTKTKKARGKEK